MLSIYYSYPKVSELKGHSMTRLSVNETLQKKGSDFKDWPHHINMRIINGSCPKCGADVLCAYADMGVNEYCDTYHHICMNSSCDYLQKKDISGIGMSEREIFGPAPCPYCRRAIR